MGVSGIYVCCGCTPASCYSLSVKVDTVTSKTHVVLIMHLLKALWICHSAAMKLLWHPPRLQQLNFGLKRLDLVHLTLDCTSSLGMTVSKPAAGWKR